MRAAAKKAGKKKSRGVISTTERAALMARVRGLACRVAAAYLEQIGGAPARQEVRA